MKATERRLSALEGHAQDETDAATVVIWWADVDGTCERGDTGEIVADADLSPDVIRIRWPEEEL